MLSPLSFVFDPILQIIAFQNMLFIGNRITPVNNNLEASGSFFYKDTSSLFSNIIAIHHPP